MCRWLGGEIMGKYEYYRIVQEVWWNGVSTHFIYWKISNIQEASHDSHEYILPVFVHYILISPFIATLLVIIWIVKQV